MKRTNPKSFVTGFVFASLLFVIYSFTNHTLGHENRDSGNSVTEVVPVSPATAVMYRNNFAEMFPGRPRALNLSVEQWNAMNQSVQSRGNGMSNMSGFRLYFGATSQEPDAALVSIAYTLNNNLQEELPGGNLYMAESLDGRFSQQCPPFCD